MYGNKISHRATGGFYHVVRTSFHSTYGLIRIKCSVKGSQNGMLDHLRSFNREESLRCLFFSLWDCFCFSNMIYWGGQHEVQVRMQVFDIWWQRPHLEVVCPNYDPLLLVIVAWVTSTGVSTEFPKHDILFRGPTDRKWFNTSDETHTTYPWRNRTSKAH